MDDVLTAARLNLANERAGEAAPPLHMSAIEPGTLLSKAAARFHTAHPSRRLVIAADTPLRPVSADPALLRRVIDNLLENARKYSGPRSIVRLCARSDGGELTVEVSDQGIGIDQADLQNVFTPFFRTDRSRARQTGGVGMGLALARRVVEAHGGTIDVESQPGQGTKVRFRIPEVTP